MATLAGLVPWEMYDQLPKLARRHRGSVQESPRVLQVVALCNKDGASGEGGSGLPSRDTVGQQILLQKLEAASRRYMRDLRRTATIDIVKRP